MAAPKGNQYAKGHGKGRPKTWDDDAIENEAEALLEWIKNPSSYYLGVFAENRGYNRAKLSVWAKSNEIFRNAYEKAQQWQENLFIHNGLTKTWDSTFTARVMARVCGDEWKNSFDKDTKDINNLDILEFISRLMQQAKAKPDANSGT